MEGKDEINKWIQFHKYNFRNYNGEQRLDKIARNLVDYEAGKIIFDAARNIIHKQNINQTELF